MTILYLLVPVALVLAGAAVWAFFWSVKEGQYDDVETPAIRILLDDASELPDGVASDEAPDTAHASAPTSTNDVAA